MAESLTQEITRRQSNTEKVLALFRSRPLEWIDWTELAEVGGALAWRTRVSGARQIIRAEGGTLENRQRRNISVERDQDRQPARMCLGAIISEYRYKPFVPLGRSADVQPPDQQALFDMGVR